jgi:hypothetical protein
MVTGPVGNKCVVGVGDDFEDDFGDDDGVNAYLPLRSAA